MGLSADLGGRILDPTYDKIRLTECACYWALDTVDEAFHFLKSLDERVAKKRGTTSRVG